MAIDSQRVYVEYTARTVQLLMVAAGKVVAFAAFAPDAKEAIAAFVANHGLQKVDLALISPAGLSIEKIAGAREKWRTPAEAIAQAKILFAPTPVDQVQVVDAAGGQPLGVVGEGALLVFGTTETALETARHSLAALGLSPARSTLALPLQWGAVIRALPLQSKTSGVIVWTLGETTSVLSRVSPSGVDAVQTVSVGYVQIFEAVQAALGLKFRAAAAKLFFNESYEFGEVAAAVAERIASAMQAALTALGGTPTALHLNGLPEPQAWFAEALAKALHLPRWTPDMAALCGQFGLQTPAGTPPSYSLAGLLAAAANDRAAAWVPSWLDANVIAVASPVPAAVLTAASTANVSTNVAVAKAKPVVAGEPRMIPFPVQADPAPVVSASVSAPVDSAAASTPAQPAPTRKKPWLLMGVGVAVIVLIGGYFLFPQQATKPVAEKPVGKPKSNEVDAGTAALAAEVRRDPSGFQNDRYQFSISDKGVLTGLALKNGPTVLVGNLGFLRLYGTKVLPGGKKKFYHAGDFTSPDYQAAVTKAVRGGAIVFDVTVQHPKFQLKQTITCLPGSLKVQVRFTPLALSDAGGALDAVYGIHFLESSQAVRGSRPAMEGKTLVYRTSRGPLTVSYTDSFKGPGSQPVIGDPGLATFVLATAQDAGARVLDYELTLP